jgi:hypothetical protein
MITEKFAMLLVTLIRDRAIEQCDSLASGRMHGPDGKKWRELVGDETVQAALFEVIPDIVDETLFCLLNAIDNEDIPLVWKKEDGTFVPLAELVRMEGAGEFMGATGWRYTFSKQRWFNPFKNVQLKRNWSKSQGTR